MKNAVQHFTFMIDITFENWYLAAFLSLVKIRPPKPSVLPDILCIGNITRPLKRSNGLSSLELLKLLKL
jgi:hypothetical protein